MTLRRPILAVILVAIVLLAMGLMRVANGGRAAADPAEAFANRSSIEAADTPEGLQVDYRKFDQRLQALMRRDDMVGLAVAVVENGEPSFVKGYGTTMAGGDEPVAPDTVFRWASVSKGVASTMVAKMVVDGRLDFGQSAAFYGSTLKLPDYAEERVTLADILSHRLGLPKNAFDGKLEDGADPRELRAELADVNATCEPGTCHSYQNVAYDTVSEIVSRAAGKDYAEAVDTALFRPLGMTSASFDLDGLVGSRSWARPHRGNRVLEVVPPYYRVPAAAGVNSDIVDLTRWMMAQMGEMPDELSPALLKATHQKRVDTRRPYGRSAFGRALDNAGYGLGWRSFDFRGRHLVGHSGAVAGYRSTIMFDPANRVGIAMLWNSSSGRPFRLPGELFDDYYGEPFTDFLELEDVPDAGENGPGTPARTIPQI